MPTERKEIPDFKVMSVTKLGVDDFELMVGVRQAAVDRIKEAKAIIAECDLRLGAILDFNETRSVTWHDEYIVTRGEAPKARTSIDATKLLGLGVAPYIIQAATVVGKQGKPRVVVRKIRGEEGGDGQDEPDGAF